MAKKYSTSRVTSQFFGMLLLVAGLGAGIVLVTQPQLLGQKAQETGYGACGGTDCDFPDFKCADQLNGVCMGTKPNCYCPYEPTKRCDFSKCQRITRVTKYCDATKKNTMCKSTAYTYRCQDPDCDGHTGSGPTKCYSSFECPSNK